MKKAELIELISHNISQLYHLYKQTSEHPLAFEAFQFNLIESLKRCNARIIEPFFAYDDAKNIVGFCLCCFDEDVQFHKERSAFFTHILFIDALYVAQKLHKYMLEFMEMVSTNKMIGPIHDSIFFERGLRTFDSLLAFTGMSTHRSYVLSTLLNIGFKKEHDLLEIIFENAVLHQKDLRLIERLQSRFKDYDIVLADGDGIAARSEEIANFYNNQWKRNWGFQPVIKEDIITFCKTIPSDKNLALFAYSKNILVGFCMILTEATAGLVRVYFIGVDKLLHNTGLAAHILTSGIDIVKSKGINLLSCAWMLESNLSITKLINKFLPPCSYQKRRYRIVSLTK